MAAAGGASPPLPWGNKDSSWVRGGGGRDLHAARTPEGTARQSGPGCPTFSAEKYTPAGRAAERHEGMRDMGNSLPRNRSDSNRLCMGAPVCTAEDGCLNC
jgi:hypothetical protein